MADVSLVVVCDRAKSSHFAVSAGAGWARVTLTVGGPLPPPAADVEAWTAVLGRDLAAALPVLKAALQATGQAEAPVRAPPQFEGDRAHDAAALAAIRLLWGPPPLPRAEGVELDAPTYASAPRTPPTFAAPAFAAPLFTTPPQWQIPPPRPSYDLENVRAMQLMVLQSSKHGSVPIWSADARKDKAWNYIRSVSGQPNAPEADLEEVRLRMARASAK